MELTDEVNRNKPQESQMRDFFIQECSAIPFPPGARLLTVNELEAGLGHPQEINGNKLPSWIKTLKNTTANKIT